MRTVTITLREADFAGQMAEMRTWLDQQMCEPARFTYKQDGAVTLKGPNTARIFRRYEEPVEATTGSNLCPVLWEASTVGARS